MVSPVTDVEISGAKESSLSAVSWGPIVAGAFAAATLSVILMLVGSGLGLTMISPWTGASASSCVRPWRLSHRPPAHKMGRYS